MVEVPPADSLVNQEAKFRESANLGGTLFFSCNEENGEVRPKDSKLVAADTFKSCQDPFDLDANQEVREENGNLIMIDTTGKG